jgi:hypothetical protein
MKKYTKTGKRTKAYEKKINESWAKFDWDKAFRKSSDYMNKKRKGLL